MYQFANYLSILVKPTNECNLNCKYCYNSVCKSEHPLLRAESFQKLCRVTFPYYRGVAFVWHGGEPTHAGLPYFRQVFEMQKTLAFQYGLIVTNSMQTNLTLINHDWVEFIKENKISCGASFDGILNDETRGSTKDFLLGKLIFEKNNLPFGVITVVIKPMLSCLQSNYEYMKGLGLSFQLNPYFTTKCEDDKFHFQCGVDEYVDSVFNLFCYWLNDEGGNINISPFCDYVAYFFGKQYRRNCSHSSCLGSWIAIEPNGDITPCSRSFDDRFIYANIDDIEDIREIYDSRAYRKILQMAVERRRKCIETCEFYDFCQGGCNNNAYVGNGIENNKDWFCKTLFSLLTKIKNYFLSLPKKYVFKNSVVRKIIE